MLTDPASCAPDGALPVTFAPPLEPGALRAIERQLHLRFNKWDTQVGDVSVLCEHPLVMRGSEWDRICAAAEALAAETKQGETELAARRIASSLIQTPAALEWTQTGGGRVSASGGAVSAVLRLYTV